MELIGITDTEGSLGEIEVDWENPPTLRELKQDLEEARPYHDAQVSKINEWLDNLHVRGAAKVPKRKGRSSVVPKLIRKQAEWRYAALSEPFLSTVDLFKASGRTFEDTKAAKQNQLLLNYQFSKQLDKNQLIDETVRTIVDEGTVIAKVGWEFEDEDYTEQVPVFEYVPDPEIVELLQEIAQLRDTDLNTFKTTVPSELEEALVLFEETGVPYRPVPTGEVEEVQKNRILKNQPTVEICDYQNVIVDPTCRGTLKKAKFIVHRFISSKADMRKDGRYKNIDRISSTTNSVLGEPDHAATSGEQNFSFNDDPRKTFVVNEYWGYRDLNGTGLLESFVASWVGNTLVRLELNPFPDKSLPFSSAPYLPVKKSIYGEPDGELLKENQLIIGALTRGMIDVMGRSANAQTGIRRDMLDPVNRRRYELGQDYEFNMNVDPRQGVHMHQFPEMPSSVQYMHQLQNMEAESLTGVKAFSGGLSGDQLGDVATGIRGVLDAASKREMGILRRLTHMVTDIGEKIMAMSGEFVSEEEVIRVTNEEYVQIRKEELQGHFDLELTISTAEEDNARAEKLEFMLQTMGPSVEFPIIQMMMEKVATLRKMPDLAKKLERYEPQPDPMQQQVQQLEIEKLQAEIQEIQARTPERLASADLDSAKAITEGAKAQNLNADTDQKGLEFLEQESGVKQERDLQKQTEQSKGNMQLEAFKSQIADKNRARDSEEEINKELLKNYLGGGGSKNKS